jgi:pimeloyl-ACP methyl ester carboxylesterase
VTTAGSSETSLFCRYFVARMAPSTSTAAVRLRDGRQLTYRSIGPASGFPVLYMHGAIGSPGWHSPQLDAAVRSLGIRYLAVNRPGFGGSDPSPGRTVADYAADVEQLADALGVERFSVIGVSAGGPFALACAWALPDRVVAAAAASPLAPACGIAGSPSLRYRVPGAGFRVPLAGPLTYDVVLRALHARSATAPRNMVEDYEVCRRPWGFEPSEVKVPVVLWHGLSDRLVPVCHALRLAAALPACATCLEPRAGHFFFSRRVGEIIASVLGTRRIDHHTNVAGVAADRLPAWSTARTAEVNRPR